MTIRGRKIFDRHGNLLGREDPVEEIEAPAPVGDVDATRADTELRVEDDRDAGASGEPAAEKIGYRNPPKSAQFKPGVSGNRKGRPKAPSLREMFLSIAGERLHKEREIELLGLDDRSRLEGAMAGLFKKAAHGDAKAIQQVFEFHRVFVGEDEQASALDEAAS